MDIFISHSSQDVDLIRELITLFEKALGIDPKSIRATSVPGYKLDPGVDTDEHIREELRRFKVLVGVLTPASLSSSYVLFELGARWGQKLSIAPLFACGASGRHLKGPISGLSALSAATDADLHHFLHAVAAQLSVMPRNPATYTDQLRKVAQLAGVDFSSKSETPAAPKVTYESPYYFKALADGSKDGPFCQKCYDTTDKLVRLQSSSIRGVWTCNACKNSVKDSNFRPPGPIKVIRT
jgi:ribosomal protein L37AE/L43A